RIEHPTAQHPGTRRGLHRRKGTRPLYPVRPVSTPTAEHHRHLCTPRQPCCRRCIRSPMRLSRQLRTTSRELVILVGFTHSWHTVELDPEPLPIDRQHLLVRAQLPLLPSPVPARHLEGAPTERDPPAVLRDPR